MRTRIVGVAVAALVLVAGWGAAAPAGAAPCPSVGSNWAGAGPFGVTTQQSGVGHTIYRPSQLGSLGCTSHPVILWGNGTFGVTTAWDGLLRHWASHGLSRPVMVMRGLLSLSSSTIWLLFAWMSMT